MPNQYEARDKAAEEFLKKLSLQNPRNEPMYRHAFNQGWHARKEADYKAAYGLDKLSGE